MLAPSAKLFEQLTALAQTNSFWFVAVSIAAQLCAARHASLAATSLSAACLWIFSVWKLRGLGSQHAPHKRLRLHGVGLLLALAQAARCAALTAAIPWWSQALVPILLGLTQALNGTGDDLSKISTSTFGTLLVSTMLALFSLDFRLLTLSHTVLGITSALSQAAAVVLLKPSGPAEILVETKQMGTIPNEEPQAMFSILRDLSASLAITSGLFSYFFEVASDISGFGLATIQDVGLSSIFGAAFLYLLVVMITNEGPSLIASLILSSSLFTNIAFACSWLKSAAGMAAMYGLYRSHGARSNAVSTCQPSRLHVWTVPGALGILLLISATLESLSPAYKPAFDSRNSGFEISATGFQVPNNIHPIKYLVQDAESRHSEFMGKQSNSLRDAVIKYKERYGIAPPPAFDKWYEFARSNNVKLYGSYDIIFDSIQPFWALRPVNIRRRVQEAIGFERNALIVMIIRNGKIVKLEGGLPWQRQALSGMISGFVLMLPDLDLAFNAHDEPRVILPHGELTGIIQQAKEGALKEAGVSDRPQNKFSSRPSDMSESGTIREYKASRFNEFAHQNTWGPSRLSCPPGSPARAVNEDLPDKTESYEVGTLGFIYNTTASSDICQVPSLRGSHAFFDRPNAFSVAHDLIPIFSESKVSSFQDIVFPSMWHWYEKIYTNRTEDMHLSNVPTYEPSDDLPWEQKAESLYWRGSTTGGWSENGGWRRHHRQRMVQLLQSSEQATILKQVSPNDNPSLWLPQTVARSSFADLVNVSFTGVGQCSEDDCRAQREYFDIAPHAPLKTAWRHKHLLDMDGNAFSARFYALLRSNSLVYKAAIFREWHDDILQPWLHYIPVSITGHDALEAVRYFSREPDGQRAAQRLAKTQQDAARTMLRRVDMEAWMFRLLLEYARVVDDNRENIGYDG